LCKAIEARDINEIDRLARAGVNVNAKSRGNMTPLLWAFPMGEDVFGKMLDLGADPNVQLTEDAMPRMLGKGKSVVSAAVELTEGYFHDQIVRNATMDNYLEQVLRHGGNPNLEDPDGNTPIFYATPPERMREKIRLLLDAGADINHRNRQGKTPVMTDKLWRYDYVLILLEAGADYRTADENGLDSVLWIEWLRMLHNGGGLIASESEITRQRSVIDWLTREGVNWEAAHAALTAPDSRKNLKRLPASYKDRPWLPQRPTLTMPNADAGK
jgi:hypothetical protein